MPSDKQHQELSVRIGRVAKKGQTQYGPIEDRQSQSPVFGDGVKVIGGEYEGDGEDDGHDDGDQGGRQPPEHGGLAPAAVLLERI